MDDSWFSAERDDADLARSIVLAMQTAYEAQPQRSVVRNVIIALLRILEGTDHAAGQQPLRIVRACAARAVGAVSEPWNITEQMFTNGRIHAAVITAGRVPAALPHKKMRGSELCLMVFCDWCRDVAFATRAWCNITATGDDGLEYTTAKQMLVAQISQLYPEFCLHARNAGVPADEIFSPSTFRRLLDDNSHGRLTQRGCLDGLWLEHVHKFWIRLAEWCRHLRGEGVLTRENYDEIAALVKEGNDHYGRLHRSCYDVNPFCRAPEGSEQPPCDPMRSMDLAMYDPSLGTWPSDGGTAPPLQFTCRGCSAPFAIMTRISDRLRDVCPPEFREQLDAELPEFCRELQRAEQLGAELSAASAAAVLPVAVAAPPAPAAVVPAPAADEDAESVDSQDAADDAAALGGELSLERENPNIELHIWDVAAAENAGGGVVDADMSASGSGGAAVADVAAAAAVLAGEGGADGADIAAAAVNAGGGGAGVAAAAVNAGGGGAGVAAAAVNAGGGGADGLGAAAPPLTPPGSAKRPVGGWGARAGLGPKGAVRLERGLVMPMEGPISGDVILRAGGTLMDLLSSFAKGLGHEQRTVIQATAVARYKVKPADRNISEADCVMDAANRCAPRLAGALHAARIIFFECRPLPCGAEETLQEWYVYTARLHSATDTLVAQILCSCAGLVNTATRGSCSCTTSL
jgi:hypothetical protein